MKKERQVEVMRRGEGTGRAGRACLTAAAGMMMAGWQNPVYECMYVGTWEHVGDGERRAP